MKRALLVGINAYPSRPLRGCLNDVDIAAAYLREVRGFRDQDIVRLTDAAATRDATVAALGALVAGARPGDSLYFHYSGHGALVPISGSDGTVTAVHGAICPVDFDWADGHPLLDTDLRAIIDRVAPGVDFVFVSDSCYSGDLTQAGRWNRPRALPTPAPIAAKLAEARAAGIRPTFLVDHDRCALLAGCRADQTSEDDYFATGFNGALTYYLFDTLRSGTWGSSALTALRSEVQGRLRDASYAQEPQLRGPDALLGRGFLQG